MKPSDVPEQYASIEPLIDVPTLRSRRITVIGLGRMGQPGTETLVRHGVATAPQGRIRLIDGDTVERRNLVATHYRTSQLGEPKVVAQAEILQDLRPDPDRELNLVLVNKHLTAKDIDHIVRFASDSDLLCNFADDFELLSLVAQRCTDICPIVCAGFGPRCDYAEVAFSVPRVTAPLHQTLGNRRRQAIAGAQALACDTGEVAAFVAGLCLRLLLGEAKGSDLFPCFANAPLYYYGIRREWIFAKEPPDRVRSAYCVSVSGPSKP